MHDKRKAGCYDKEKAKSKENGKKIQWINEWKTFKE